MSPQGSPSATQTLSRRERLERLLNGENSKKVPAEQVKKTRSPAKYRDLLTSSSAVQHSHTTREDVVKGQVRTAEAQARTASRTASKGLSTASNAAAPQPVMGMNFSSAFKSRPEQGHTIQLAEQNRRAKAESEWALLTKFEKTLADVEREQRRQMAKERIDAQRAALDQQMAEKDRLKKLELEAKAEEMRVMREQMEAFKEDERRKRDTIRQRDEQVKKERERQLKEVKDLRNKEIEKKKRHEAAEVQRIQEQLEQDRIAAEEKKKQMARAMQETLKQNAFIQEQKNEKAKQQAALDEATMQQYIQRLEREEAERAQKLEDFKRSVQEKASRVGGIVVKEAEEREKKETELLEKLARKKEREEQRKEKEQKRTRKKMQQELKYTVEQQKAIKAQVEADMKEKDVQYGAMVRVADEKARNEELEKKLQARMRNIQHRQYLEGQIFEREQRDTVDNVYMTHQERRLNHEILQEAVKTHPDLSSSQFLAGSGEFALVT